MAPKVINYDNTCFYKLCCKDLTVTDIYVGHTTDFIRRKANHKRACTSEASHRHHLYVYKFIRKNGGWDNWDMVLLDKCSCKDVLEAGKKERNYIEELGATLNVLIPTRTGEERYVENKDKIKLYLKENKDKISERHKLYCKLNKHKINEKYREWYELNIDRLQEKAKQYREVNEEIIKERRRQYYEKNKDILNQRKREKRAQQKHQNVIPADD